ncbi:hypothetical protein [uncultured Dubosiella sp.]|uniref:hypothetical protein n=1 Tax=uncultured Dubosiella sp. TaxID=1937011 RepID=UPI0025B2915F|nr:hypothetical protein [uncultured Dubosiella sp.]
MKKYIWIFVLIGAIVLGMIVFSFFGGTPRPIEVEPVGEQTDRVSDMMEDMDLFSPEKKATNEMIEGTVGY